MKLCESCSAHHKWCARFQDHSIIDIEGASNDELLEDEAPKCPHHQRKLELYCQTCSVRACNDCIGQHRDHRFRSLKEVNAEELKVLEDSLQESETVSQRYEEHLQKMEDFHRNASDERERSRKEINAAFTDLVDILMRQKQKLFDWMDQDDQYSTYALKTVKERLSHVRSMASYLKDVKLHSHDEVFDTMNECVTQLNINIEDMTESLTAATPIYERSDNYSLRNDRESNTNDFDFCLTSRRVKTSEFFAGIKSSLEQMVTVINDEYIDSVSKKKSSPRLDSGFRFIESVFPQQTGVVRKEANKTYSSNVQIGNFEWLMEVEKYSKGTFEEDITSCWWFCCYPLDSFMEYWNCDVVFNLIIKNQSGGEDYKCFDTPIVAHFTEDECVSDQRLFKDTIVSWEDFRNKGLVVDDSMILEVHGGIQELPRTVISISQPNNFLNRLHRSNSFKNEVIKYCNRLLLLSCIMITSMESCKTFQHFLEFALRPLL